MDKTGGGIRESTLHLQLGSLNEASGCDSLFDSFFDDVDAALQEDGGMEVGQTQPPLDRPELAHLNVNAAPTNDLPASRMCPHNGSESSLQSAAVSNKVGHQHTRVLQTVVLPHHGTHQQYARGTCHLSFNPMALHPKVEAVTAAALSATPPVSQAELPGKQRSAQLGKAHAPQQVNTVPTNSKSSRVKQRKVAAKASSGLPLLPAPIGPIYAEDNNEPCSKAVAFGLQQRVQNSSSIEALQDSVVYQTDGATNITQGRPSTVQGPAKYVPVAVEGPSGSLAALQHSELHELMHEVDKEAQQEVAAVHARRRKRMRSALEQYGRQLLEQAEQVFEQLRQLDGSAGEHVQSYSNSASLSMF